MKLRKELKNKYRLDKLVRNIPIDSSSRYEDFVTVPADLMSAFQLMPYVSSKYAVFKALGWSKICNHLEIEI